MEALQEFLQVLEPSRPSLPSALGATFPFTEERFVRESIGTCGVFRDLRSFWSTEDDYNVILGCGKHLSPIFGVILKIVFEFQKQL